MLSSADLAVTGGLASKGGNRRRRLGIVLVLTLLAAATTVGLVAAPRTPADAACNGGGSPTTLYTYNSGGTLVAEEAVVYPGTTCNGDAVYQGAVLDPVTDGSCAYVYYLEPFAYYGLQGASCTTGAWSFYSYNDTIGANAAFVSVRPSYLGDYWFLSSGY